MFSVNDNRRDKGRTNHSLFGSAGSTKARMTRVRNERLLTAKRAFIDIEAKINRMTKNSLLDIVIANRSKFTGIVKGTDIVDIIKKDKGEGIVIFQSFDKRRIKSKGIRMRTIQINHKGHPISTYSIKQKKVVIMNSDYYLVDKIYFVPFLYYESLLYIK